VLGAGGSARAVVWALARAGAEVAIWNRTAERAEALAGEIGARAVTAAEGPEALARYDLLVNATSVGLESANGASEDDDRALADLKALHIPADGFEARYLVVDLVYGSAGTPLASAARARGATVIDGLEVLVHQGAASLRLWTGREAPIDVMRSAARSG
jgi:shikimate dehydrogenase